VEEIWAVTAKIISLQSGDKRGIKKILNQVQAHNRAKLKIQKFNGGEGSSEGCFSRLVIYR
jgi:hypothetical protein